VGVVPVIVYRNTWLNLRLRNRSAVGALPPAPPGPKSQLLNSEALRLTRSSVKPRDSAKWPCRCASMNCSTTFAGGVAALANPLTCSQSTRLRRYRFHRIIRRLLPMLLCRHSRERLILRLCTMLDCACVTPYCVVHCTQEIVIAQNQSG